jgi:hypothetical protein
LAWSSPRHCLGVQLRDPNNQRRNIVMGAMALLAGLAFARALTTSDSGAQFVYLLLGGVFLLILWAMYRWPDR